MAGLPLERVLMLGYALSVALIAFLLEWMGAMRTGVPGGQHCRFHLSSRPRRLAVSARPASVSRFFGFNKRDRNLQHPRGSL